LLLRRTLSSHLLHPPTGTAIAGCGSAWTKGFNMDQNLAADHLQKVARASISRVIRMESNNSLELDEDLFSGEHQRGEERSEASDHEESLAGEAAEDAEQISASAQEAEGAEQLSASAQAAPAGAEPAPHDEEASDSESEDEKNEESPYDNIRGCQMSSAAGEGRDEAEEDTEEDADTKATAAENEAVAANK
jgi:hypothetical protein